MKTDASVNKTIAIFGGTFDPPHLGHSAIVSAFLKSEIPDEIWILPTPVPPFKSDQRLTPFEHRFRMTQIAFKNANRVHVKDYESQFIGTSYTIQTLEKLAIEFPQTNWMLCVGQDNLNSFQDWHRYEDILSIATLLVAARPGFDSDLLPDIIQSNCRFVAHTPVSISSTAIRRDLLTGFKPKQITREVFKYIQKHKLYTE